jgi:hypothetical protein
MIIRNQSNANVRWSESGQNQRYRDQKTINDKRMWLENEQKQRHSDDKKIKAKCIVILKGPLIKI